MNILKAIKSGRDYRRKGHTAYYTNITELIEPGFETVAFEYSDLMAEDWELRPSHTHAVLSLPNLSSIIFEAWAAQDRRKAYMQDRERYETGLEKAKESQR